MKLCVDSSFFGKPVFLVLLLLCDERRKIRIDFFDSKNVTQKYFDYKRCDDDMCAGGNVLSKLSVVSLLCLLHTQGSYRLKSAHTQKKKNLLLVAVVIAADDDYGGMLMLQSQDQESNKM